MISLTTILLLVWTHLFADFFLQTDRIAINKSSKNTILLLHVCLYGVCFVFFGVVFAIVNTALHFIVDWGTSRLTSNLWKAGERHWFFVVIGIDQALHFTCLFTTYLYLK